MVAIRELCEVCNKNKPYGVFSSVCGPISLAYCVECSMKSAEPVGFLAAYLCGAVSKGSDLKPENNLINKSYQSIITASVEVAGITLEEFYDLVDDLLKKEKEFYEGLKDELNEFVGKENNEENHNKIISKASKYLEGEVDFDG